MSVLGAISAGVGALGGLIGGLFNSGSQSKTNKTNLQIARETNQANAQVAQANRDWQENMWHQQNAYNDPSAQMARYTAAGLNPNLIYGQGSNGNATSVGSPPTPTYQAAHMESTRPGDAVLAATQGVANALEYDLRRKDLESQISLRDSQEAAQRASVYETNAKVLDILQRAALTKQQRLQAGSLFQYQLESQRLETENMNQRLIASQNDNSLFDLRKNHLETQIRLLNAGVVKSEAEAKETSAKIWKISQEVLNLAEQRNQIRQLARHTLNENLFMEATQKTRVSMVAKELTNLTEQGKLLVEQGKLVVANTHLADYRWAGEKQKNKYYGRFGYNSNPVGNEIGTLVTFLTGGL